MADILKTGALDINSLDTYVLSFNGDIESGSNVITNITWIGDSSVLIEGLVLVGNSNIPLDTTIVSIDSPTQITISNNATGSETSGYSDIYCFLGQYIILNSNVYQIDSLFNADDVQEGWLLYAASEGATNRPLRFKISKKLSSSDTFLQCYIEYDAPNGLGYETPSFGRWILSEPSDRLQLGAYVSTVNYAKGDETIPFDGYIIVEEEIRRVLDNLSITGINGLTGLQGVTGLEGLIGSTGLEGIQGVTGILGIDGVTGLEGIQGIQGVTGVFGLDGLTGIQGEQGATGIGGTDTYSGTAERTVGGITEGAVFTNATMTEMWDTLIKQEKYPTLTAPSSTFNSSVTGLYEISTIVNINFDSTFNRGSISPQYTATSPYRSGTPNNFNYSGVGLTDASTSSLTDAQSVTGYTVMGGSQSWTGRVFYDPGVQPKSSYGNNYSSPLSAGSTAIVTRTITGVYPTYATTVSISVLTKNALAAHNSTYIQTDVVAEGGGYKQTADFPDAWSTITGIQFYNTVSSQWEWIGGSKANSLTTFSTSGTTHVVQGNTISYISYENNGALIGARQLRWYTN